MVDGYQTERLKNYTSVITTITFEPKGDPSLRSVKGTSSRTPASEIPNGALNALFGLFDDASSVTPSKIAKTSRVEI